MKSQYQPYKDIAISAEFVLRFERVTNYRRKNSINVTKWEGPGNGRLDCQGIVLAFPQKWLPDILQSLEDTKTFIEQGIAEMDELEIRSIGGSDWTKADVLAVEVAKHPDEVIVRIGYCQKNWNRRDPSNPHVCVPSIHLPRLIEIVRSLKEVQGRLEEDKSKVA